MYKECRDPAESRARISKHDATLKRSPISRTSTGFMRRFSTPEAITQAVKLLCAGGGIRRWVPPRQRRATETARAAAGLLGVVASLDHFPRGCLVGHWVRFCSGLWAITRNEGG